MLYLQRTIGHGSVYYYVPRISCINCVAFATVVIICTALVQWTFATIPHNTTIKAAIMQPISIYSYVYNCHGPVLFEVEAVQGIFCHRRQLR